MLAHNWFTYFLQNEHALGDTIAGHGQRDWPLCVVLVNQFLHSSTLLQSAFLLGPAKHAVLLAPAKHAVLLQYDSSQI